MNILVTDPLSPAGLVILRNAGHQVDERIGITLPQLLEIIPDYDVLLVRSGTKVTDAVFEATHRLQIVGRAGSGVDNIDVESATRHGVLVMNTPGGNSIAVAELTICMMLSAARSVPFAHRELCEGTWDRKKWKGVELYGRTLGIIGFGQIGQEVAIRAAAFGMRVLAHDAFVGSDAIAAAGCTPATLEGLVADSDVISVHVPLLPATHHLINDDVLAKCRKGLILINCARGGVVDEGALFRALQNGTVLAAALDVFEQEPPLADNPLVNHPQVVVTPHIGAATHDAQERVAVLIAQQVVSALTGGSVVGGVNAKALRTPIAS